MKPTDLLTAEWYYMTYHKADYKKFAASRKKLSNETIKSLTKYLQALFTQKKCNGKLKKRGWTISRGSMPRDSLRQVVVQDASCAMSCAMSSCGHDDNHEGHGNSCGISQSRSRKPSGSSQKLYGGEPCLLHLLDGGEPCSLHSPPRAPPARPTWE